MATSSPPVTCAAQSDRFLPVHQSLSPLPQPTSSHMLFARLVFLNPQPDQSSSPTSGEPPAAPQIFPSFHLFLALVPITPSNDLQGHYGSTVCRAVFSAYLLIALVKGSLPRVWHKSLSSDTIVVPRQIVWHCPVLWTQKESANSNP